MKRSVFLTGLEGHGPLRSMGQRRPSFSFDKDAAVFHLSDFWSIAQERLMATRFFGIPQRKIVWNGVLGTLGMERKIGSILGLDRRRRRLRERNTGLRRKSVDEKDYWDRKDKGPEQVGPSEER